MSKEKQPFWETNLNPITMFAPSIPKPKHVVYARDHKGNFLKNDQLDDYVAAIDLRKEYKIGARRLKELFASLKTPPKYNRGSTYYSTEHIERAREIMSSMSKTAVVDLEKYISNQELMEMFGFNTYKAWYIAKTAKLSKTKHSGNVNYYEREKAIAEFSKYIK